MLWMLSGDEPVSIKSFVGTKDRNAVGESHGNLLEWRSEMGSQGGIPGSGVPSLPGPAESRWLLSRVLMSPGRVRLRRDPSEGPAPGRGSKPMGEG